MKTTDGSVGNARESASGPNLANHANPADGALARLTGAGAGSNGADVTAIGSAGDRR